MSKAVIHHVRQSHKNLDFIQEKPASGKGVSKMKTILELIKEHPFFKGFDESEFQFIASCGKRVVFRPLSYIAKESEEANAFYLIIKGHVEVEIHVSPKRHLTLQTLHAGDILGWSWLYPPYTWRFDVSAVDEVLAIALDGKCLRDKCEEDPKFGYKVMKRFARIMTERLHAARMQLIEAYGGSLAG